MLNIPYISSTLNIRDKTYAKPNRYYVWFQPPQNYNVKTLKDVAELALSDLDVLSMIKYLSTRCSATSIPGESIATNPIRYAGPERLMPYQQNYTDASFTFDCSPSHKEYRYFQAWQNLIMDNKTHSLNYYDNYIGSVVVIQYSDSGYPTFGCILEEAYPTGLSEISLGYAQTNTIASMTVTFTYRKREFIFAESIVKGILNSPTVQNFGSEAFSAIKNAIS